MKITDLKKGQKFKFTHVPKFGAELLTYEGISTNSSDHGHHVRDEKGHLHIIRRENKNVYLA